MFFQNETERLLEISLKMQYFLSLCRIVSSHVVNAKHVKIYYCSLIKFVTESFKYIHFTSAVAFRIYDMDKDGYISNGELFQVLKMMVGNNLKDTQLQQIVDKTIINADKDGDGRISFEEFCAVSNLYRNLWNF